MSRLQPVAGCELTNEYTNERTKTLFATTIKLTSCNLQQTYITTAITVTICKEMGGATSHARQSGVRSVSNRLIPSIGRYAVIGCKLQIPVHNTVHVQCYANQV